MKVFEFDEISCQSAPYIDEQDDSIEKLNQIHVFPRYKAVKRLKMNSGSGTTVVPDYNSQLLLFGLSRDLKDNPTFSANPVVKRSSSAGYQDKGFVY